MVYECVMEHNGISVGDHVAKKKNPNNPRSIKYVGRVLAIYKEPHLDDWWMVVLLDENEASDRLQHLYPFDLFEKLAE